MSPCDKDAMTSARQWIKRRDHPMSQTLYHIGMSTRRFSLPVVPVIHRSLYELRRAVISGWANAPRVLWYTPLFQSRLAESAVGLHLDNGIPYVVGPLTLRVGQGCRLAGKLDICGCSTPGANPELIIGNNVDVGWSGTINVGRRIVIGDNVRIAPGVVLAGYPGHPLDASARARGEGETIDQVGDIVLHDNVWLATRVTVLAGVTIGAGTVVGAGSVVTSDLPSGVLAAGVPAKIVRHLEMVPAAKSGTNSEAER